jgi:hypothetical protein
MAKDARCAFQLDDDEDGRPHAVWSRSGKHLIVTATTHRWSELIRVELRPDQVREPIHFLVETVELLPSNR